MRTTVLEGETNLFLGVEFEGPDVYPNGNVL